MFLKQSTNTQYVLIGPFLDEDDGKTAETGLSIGVSDIRLGKAGGNIVAKNSGGATHDELGFYQITLDSTDTATVGELLIAVHKSGALPVFKYCYVLEEDIYDAMFAASASAFDANARVDVASIEGSDATDQINAACDASIETYGLDHLLSASVAGSDVTDNSIVAKLVSKESTADWDDYVNTTDSLQAQRDYTGSGYTAIPWNSSWDAEVQSECADALTAHWGATLTESYANDNAAATPAQLLYMIYSACSQFTVSGTDLNCYGLDGSTVKMKFTLDDATSPTERKRASSP